MIRLPLKEICLTLAGLLCAAAAPAVTAPNPVTLRGEGTVRDADALSDGVLFRISYEHTSVAGRPVSTKIEQHDLNGSVLVEEQTLYGSDGRFKSYTMRQHQTGESIKVNSDSKNLLMSFTTDGKTSTTKDTLSDNTTAPGAIMAYLNGYVEQVKAGSKIPIRLAVAEKGMVFNFEIQSLPAGCAKGQGDLCVNMTAGNFFLRGLVKPVFMAFHKSNEGFRPLAIETPAIVRRKDGKSLRKFTARIDYPASR